MMMILAILPPLFVSSSIGEEIEDRTTTYLWSRPLARWTVVGGKLLALVPVVLALALGGWFVAYEIAGKASPPIDAGIALAAVALVWLAIGMWRIRRLES